MASRSSLPWFCSQTAATVAAQVGLPWAALTIDTAASLAANIAAAELGAISRIIAGWPALALLIAVKLLSGILEHRPAAVPARPSAGRDPG